MTRSSMRRTAIRSPSAASPIALRRARGSASRNVLLMARRRSKGSMSIVAKSRMRRSPFSFTAAPGATALPRNSLPRRTVRACRRAFRRARLHHCRGCRRQSVSDGRAGAPRGRLRLSQRRKFGGDRNRLHLISHSSGSHLAGCAVTRDWAKEGFPSTFSKALCCRAACTIWTGAAVEAFDICEVHRWMETSFPPSAISTGSTRRSCSATALTRRRNSSASPATSRRGESRRQAGELLVGEGYNHFEMLERSPIRMACSAARCSNRWDCRRDV